MKNLISRMPKKALLVAASLIGVLSIGAGVHAWYPGRPTYTVAHPADHVTFNSITDNPREGDERAFFEVKDAANTQSDGFSHKTTVYDGETVLLRMYVHNDAADNLNGTNWNGSGVAKNTQVRVWLPSVSDSVMRANAYVSADNASPQVVSDTVDFAAPQSNQKFTLSYVPNSAYTYNNYTGQAGMQLSNNIVTSGALIGEKKADGIVPGCFQFVNIVTLKVKVHLTTPNFQVEKSVALPGSKTWSKDVTAQPGQTVDYQIAFKNTGNSTLNDVVIRDLLPKGESIVSGSTKLYNANYPSGTNLGTDAVVANGGISIGSYTAGSNAYVQFKATLPSNSALTCGMNTLTNTAEAITGGQNATDTAKVDINKTCANTPTYTCSAFHVTKGDNRTVTVDKFVFNASNNAKLSSVDVNWGDNATLTTNKVVGQTHQYGKDGTYTISLSNFKVNGKTVDVAGDCSQTVTFTSKPTIPGGNLPNTGAGNVIGLFAAITVAGAFAHRLFLSRKLARD